MTAEGGRASLNNVGRPPEYSGPQKLEVYVLLERTRRYETQVRIIAVKLSDRYIGHCAPQELYLKQKFKSTAYIDHALEEEQILYWSDCSSPR
jgi:hypothetical protein